MRRVPSGEETPTAWTTAMPCLKMGHDATSETQLIDSRARSRAGPGGQSRVGRGPVHNSAGQAGQGGVMQGMARQGWAGTGGQGGGAGQAGQEGARAARAGESPKLIREGCPTAAATLLPADVPISRHQQQQVLQFDPKKLTCTAARTSRVSGYMLTTDFRLSKPALSSSELFSLPTSIRAVEPMDKFTFILKL